MNIQDIQTLRKETGASLVECRNALTTHDGDVAKAIESLLEKGLRLVEKKADRVAADGIALARTFGDRAVLVEVNTETDFVAGNEEFKALVESIAEAIARHTPADVDTLKDVPLASQEMTVGELVQKMVMTFGENIVIRRFAALAGPAVHAYMHQHGKIGVILSLDVKDPLESSLQQQAEKELALQIAAMNPRFVSREGLTMQEQETIRQQIEQELAEDPDLKAKPAPVREKIASGRLDKYYKTHALMEQASIRDDDQSVRDYLDSLVGKPGIVEVSGFHRFEKAEGIEAEPVFCPLFNNPF